MNVVVVGAGFSGTMVAVHLARQTRTPAAIALVERTGRFGAGVAYATAHACHLLNVPAGRMSAFSRDPDHFVRWAIARDPSVHASSFLPRQWYSAYLADLLDAARIQTADGTSLRQIDSEVTAISRAEPHGWQVHCADGSLLLADVVVLAIGNYPPANPPSQTAAFYQSRAYRQDPWAPDALAVDADQDVLLLGTGLTMVDVAVALHHNGHRGHVTAGSRRGLLPQWLRETAPAPADLPPPVGIDSWPRTARGLLRGVRDAVTEREREHGGDWRDVVASLRSVTPSLWQSLPLSERRRFLRHVRPYWDTHRHGAAPVIGETIDRLRRSGQLRVMAARVVGYEMRDDGVHATMRRRGDGSLQQIRVDRVINCTGPDTNLARVASPLIVDLHRRDLIHPDPLAIGVLTDQAGRVVGRDGVAQEGLYLTGPLTRGLTWEHIAVPELRDGAEQLAEQVMEHGVAVG